MLLPTCAGEPALVSAAASLLTCILAHNAAALSRLYLSGAFLFGLAYCGSNLEELAGLFKAAHLVQGFRCGGCCVNMTHTCCSSASKACIQTTLLTDFAEQIRPVKCFTAVLRMPMPVGARRR